MLGREITAGYIISDLLPSSKRVDPNPPPVTTVNVTLATCSLRSRKEFLHVKPKLLTAWY